MNLVDMAARKDPQLHVHARIVSIGDDRWRRIKLLVSKVVGRYVITAKRTVDGIRYRGFDVSVDGQPKIILRSACMWYPFRLAPEWTGWHIVAIDRRAEGGSLQIALRERATGKILASRLVKLTRKLEPVGLPSSPAEGVDCGDVDLELMCSGEGGRAFLAVHRIMDRAEVLSLCRGNGVELGPGPHPQLLSDETRDVIYVEQSPVDQWNRLYNEHNRYRVDPTLWARYRIGEGCALPADGNSLDFIFSSHVFEHLANPLGHLEHWYTKLRGGGVVAGVVPDVGGSKDYVFEPCSVKDFLDEYAAGEMQPQLVHYQRWAAARAPGKDPVGYWQAKRSIHVHFYTADNMRALLELAVAKIGFAWFRIWHTPNHKDLYFALGK